MPLVKQCRMLSLSRSGVYYAPAAASDKDKELMWSAPTQAAGASGMNCGTRAIRSAEAACAPS
ncbi:MAG: hypothetical protein ABSD38_33265 [Syntrophorhabdales bacterium]